MRPFTDTARFTCALEWPCKGYYRSTVPGQPFSSRYGRCGLRADSAKESAVAFTATLSAAISIHGFEAWQMQAEDIWRLEIRDHWLLRQTLKIDRHDYIPGKERGRCYDNNEPFVHHQSRWLWWFSHIIQQLELPLIKQTIYPASCSSWTAQNVSSYHRKRCGASRPVYRARLW